MPAHRHGFSIMPLPIFLVLGIIVGFAVHKLGFGITLSVLAGIASFPLSVWMLDLIFNSPLALRFQNLASNHVCPSCEQKYTAFVSMAQPDKSIVIRCLKCGQQHRYDRAYKLLDPNETTQNTTSGPSQTGTEP